MNTNSTPKKPLLTPGQNDLLNLPQIKSLISRFDLHAFSSPQAQINSLIHYRSQLILSKISNSKHPLKPDFNNFAPLSQDGTKIIKDFFRINQENNLPKGISLDSNGKQIFDRNFKAKGISEKELPPQHPDYVPF